jgi:hypothetical protein
MRGRLFATAALLALTPLARPDTIRCKNGDMLNGEVIAMSAKDIKFRSELHGVVTIPRSKVVSISLGEAKPAAATEAATDSAALPAVPKPSAALKKIQSKENAGALSAQVEAQYLADATPEARQMYQEMVSGFLSGKMNLQDISVQAQSALKQLKELQGEMGDDDATGALLSSYASILENFVKQVPASTNSPAPALRAPVQDADEH